MAVTDNSIGRFNVLTIHGNWIPPAQQVEIDQRHGVDGTRVTKLGKRGTPFRIVSQQDTSSYSAAQAKLGSYQSLIGKNPVTLTKAGESSADAGFRVQVLDVQPRRIIKITSAVGGNNSPSGGWIEAVWTLLAIAS